MTTVLKDYQFELDGFVWGLDCPVFVDEEGFDPGDAEKIVQDAINPRTGTRMFGRDRTGAPTWTWACFLSTEEPEDALEAVEDMAAVWRNEIGEQDSGSVKALRYAVGGRTRVVYGRPRKFSYKPGNGLLVGNLPPLATFDLSDSKHYDDVEEFIDVRLAPQIPGGFVVPFEAPLVVSREVDASEPGAMVVGGRAGTYPVITFYGPVTNPSITIGNNFKVGLEGTLSAGASYTVDTRPFLQTTKKVGGGNVTLSRDTRLADIVVYPGAYSAVYKGTDNTGTSYCRVAWRKAFYTL